MLIKKKCGFTMIELIVVITLIGILGVYAQSRFDTTAFDERFFADDLISSMRFAQKYALATGCATQVNITISGFNLMGETSAECSASTVTTFNQTILRPWQAIAYVNQAPLPSTITLTAASFIFYPQGWACNATGDSATVSQVILAGDSTTRTINLVCSTGFVYQT